MKQFTQNGFQLEYPDEWELEYDNEENPNNITFYSPDGTFWTLMRRPGFVESDDLLEEAVDALAYEYDDVDTSTAQEVYAGRKIEGYDIDFFYLDLPCTAIVRVVSFDMYTYLIYAQMMNPNSAMLNEINNITRYWVEHLEDFKIEDF